MLRKLLFTVTILAATFLANAQTDSTQSVPCDTLLNASTASSIYVISSASSTAITVKNLNGGQDTFFYSSGNQKKAYGSITQTQINYPDISDIVVCETPNDVKIRFTSSEGEPLSYTFTFADPDNRSIKSYIGTKGSDFGFTISHKKSTKWDVISDGIGFGWGTPINTNTDMDVSMWKSSEFIFNMILGIKMTHRRHSLSMGFGIHWQELTTKGPNYFSKNNDGKISLIPYADGQTNGESRINLFSLQIPLLYGIKFGHKNYCGFKLGPVLNFNTGAHIETKYSFEGSDYKIKTGDINQRRVTLDGMAIFNYRCIGVYARYAPMKRLNTSTGLEFGTFSTGIMLSF